MILTPIFHCDAKPFTLGPGIGGLRPPTPRFRVTYTNMLISKIAKISFAPTPNLKCALSPTPTPDAVEFRLSCVPNAKFPHWQCTFHFICVDFQFPVEYGLKRRSKTNYNATFDISFMHYILAACITGTLYTQKTRQLVLSA